MFTIRIHAGSELVHSTDVPDHRADALYNTLERAISAGQFGEPIGMILDVHDTHSATRVYSRSW